MRQRATILATLLLAACIPSSSEKSPRTRSLPPQTSSVPPDRATAKCHADLRREEVGFRILPDRNFGGGCTSFGSVQLLDIGTPVTNLGAMTCPLARQFARWAREAVQPAARSWLGNPVARIESFGTYSCRPVNSQSGAKLSEHGRSNAVDIAAFVLVDGRRIDVLRGWNSEDEDIRRFLRAVHQAGCRRFQIGLGPNADSFHRNHFHFDMGRGPYCR
ncbi:extensin-like domain-containing protein [Sphingosinicella rhizophila]|uniref:Extensin family protein n=1 Tax=Sphingosinicella rhizophila TaxID=3050082 RepID=A0ABU3Q3V4_9SPHN|nr:extensin family protein [Sphingosinicella sp. GR2756]MDT9598095.1 extensin family protein [Sphingosinicella sp. GR2756]